MKLVDAGRNDDMRIDEAFPVLMMNVQSEADLTML